MNDTQSATQWEHVDSPGQALVPTRRTVLKVPFLYTADGFSKSLMWGSMALFLVIQVVLGALAGKILLGTFVSQHTRMLVEGGINLGSYALGGFIIGFVTPQLRLFEPAVGAFLALLAAMTVAWFTPYLLYWASLDRMIFGGALAFALAYLGARAGEKLGGRM